MHHLGGVGAAHGVQHGGVLGFGGVRALLAPRLPLPPLPPLPLPLALRFAGLPPAAAAGAARFGAMRAVPLLRADIKVRWQQACARWMAARRRRAARRRKSAALTGVA